MSINWVHGRYREDSMIFDSTWEAEEWANSLYPEFIGEGFVNVGYATPDKKVADFLIREIPRWAEILRSHDPSIPSVTVRSSPNTIVGRLIFKAWIEPKKH
ncbi:hypothetical protein [Alicyclobacillus ferrooxydans]|uniref:Uncharacterized protein n=1 Tax=Alicyclobacillus ferrooxydans TaxID=471514 RepID=A0A0N8PPE4_9BACL|nr:hypothetical protein [Alicyclobacillus ferrooxydans]KPV44093.1 hypothetical protein AN477_08420 [Alicyclobacillus ferrooxydans]